MTNWATVGKIALGVSALGAIALVAAACGDNTPPPTPGGADETDLFRRLTSSGFSNRQQTAVQGDIRANSWNAPEAGNFLTLARNTLGTHDAINAWRMTKYNNRSTTEISGLIQALDSNSALYDSEIMRVVTDVISANADVAMTKNYFAAARYNSWTSNHEDIKHFEHVLGLSYPGWHYPGSDVIYEPYPVYVPDVKYDYYYKDPGYWSGYDWPTSGGDDPIYEPYPKPYDPGYGGYDPPTSGGDDPVYDPGGYKPPPSYGDDPVYDPGYGGYEPPSYGDDPVYVPDTPTYDPGYDTGGGYDDSSDFGNPDFE